LSANTLGRAVRAIVDRPVSRSSSPRTPSGAPSRPSCTSRGCGRG
jgi:hypothetical protein